MLQLQSTAMAQQFHVVDAPDIDPNDPGATAQEVVEPSPYQLPSTAPPQPAQPDLPTVLKKLQKWGDYASWGTVVQPTRFIPCKTPLSEEIHSHWNLPEAPRHRLTVSALVDAQQQQGRHIGMILDLSNHECLYTDDIPSHVHYEHIKLVAKELPPRSFVTEVCNAAEAYWAKHPDHYIAIHCAYGFNRTGFVVCCFLIERCGLTVDQALSAFGSARPPGVKHEAFKAELRARYEQQAEVDTHPSSTAAQGQGSFSQLGEGQLQGGAIGGQGVLYRRDISNTSLCQSDSQQGATQSQDQEDVGEAAGSEGGEAAGSEGGEAGWEGDDTCGGLPDISPAPAAQLPVSYLDHTPDALLHSGVTPVSDNDSLGFNDRMVMQGLRAQLALRQLGALQLKPSQLENLLQAAASPGSPSAAQQGSLSKRSVGQIDWSSSECTVQETNNDTSKSMSETRQ